MTNEKQAAILSGRALGFSDGITKEKYDLAMKMAQWKDQEFAKQKQALIDKACEWLKKHWGDYYAPVEWRKLTSDFENGMNKLLEEKK